MNAKSGGNFNEYEFVVKGEVEILTVSTSKNSYNINETITFSGSGARSSATVTLKIFDSQGGNVDELNINAKSNGEYITIWQIPVDLEAGEYEVTVDDGASNARTVFTIN